MDTLPPRGPATRAPGTGRRGDGGPAHRLQGPRHLDNEGGPPPSGAPRSFNAAGSIPGPRLRSGRPLARLRRPDQDPFRDRDPRRLSLYGGTRGQGFTTKSWPWPRVGPTPIHGATASSLRRGGRGRAVELLQEALRASQSAAIPDAIQKRLLRGPSRTWRLRSRTSRNGRPPRTRAASAWCPERQGSPADGGDPGAQRKRIDATVARYGKPQLLLEFDDDERARSTQTGATGCAGWKPARRAEAEPDASARPTTSRPPGSSRRPRYLWRVSG